MTMFSMKPKFNLAEFLAVPASAGAARSAGTRRRGTPIPPATTPEDATETAPSDDTPATDGKR